MHFMWPLVLGDIRRFAMLFLICGIGVYLIDFRGLRDKKKYEREALFSKAVAILYLGGGALVVISTWVFERFV